jgi:Ca2+-binding EF-hand superfamily protein
MKTNLNRSLRLALLPVACAAALTGCAPYDPNGNSVYISGGPTAGAAVSEFDRYDTNRDGYLSRAEVQSFNLPAASPAAPRESAADMFRRLDTNGDAFVSRGEAGTTFNAIPGGSFDAFDTNRDGFLSMNEAMPHLTYLANRAAPPSNAMSFDSLDANRDGFLSRAEAAPLWSSGAYATAPAAPVPSISFDSLDANRDGFLSRAEAAAIANPLQFDQYDTNRDGFLSRGEADYLLRSGVGGTYGAPTNTIYGPRY